MRPSRAACARGEPNASSGVASSRKKTRSSEWFQNSCSWAAACGVAGVCSSVTGPRPEWSTQRASLGSRVVRTERTTWLSKATAPKDTKPDATIVARTAQRANVGRKQVATARPASSVAATAISSDPSAIPIARSSRKAASRNGESCFASLIV